MKRLSFITNLFVMCMLLVGCGKSNSLIPSEYSGPVATIQNSSDQHEKAYDRANIKVDENTKTADLIREKTEDTEVIAATESIKRNNSLIKDELNTMKESVNTIENQVPEIAKNERELERLLNEKDSPEEKLFNLLAIMFGFGGVIIVSGIVLAFFNSRTGLMVAGLGIMVTLIAAAGTYFLKWLAITGFVIIGLGLAVTVYVLIKNFKTAKEVKEGFVENVKLVENIKEKLPEEKKQEIFGYEKKGIADEIQSESTKKNVLKVREEIKKDGSKL